MAEGKEKIILPLDVDTVEAAEELVRKLKDEVGAFKVGLELFNAAGPMVFERLKAAGASRIFYDCKFHDIPNTVAGAVRAAARHSPWLINVHAAGGWAMMKAARQAAEQTADQYGIERPKLLGVTVLTSVDQAILSEEIRVEDEISEYVVHLAELSSGAGMDGVVASPREIELIREVVPPDFLIVTPGVRPAGAEVGDQKRVMTPGEAVKKGADYLVVGRPIYRAVDPVAAARSVAGEIDSASV